jgi:uncharacterized protein (DUF58 family)
MVAWKLSARSLAASDELLVRESATLSGQRVCVQVEPRAPELEKVLELAASLVSALVSTGASVSLMLGELPYAPVRSIRQMGPMLDGMARWDGEPRSGKATTPRAETYLRIGAAAPDRLSAADLERLALRTDEDEQ